MRTQTLNIRRILVYVAILSVFMYFALSWVRMIGDLYERTGSDFIGFYGFGRIPQATGNISDIYRVEQQQALQEEIVGHPVTPIFYTHLPYIAPIAMAIVNDNYTESFQRWAIVLLGLNALNVYLLVNTLNWRKLSKENLIILCAGAYLFDPTFSGFMNGQDTAILLLGAAIFLREFFKGNYFLAGLGLSLTTVRPQIALFLAIPFFFKYRNVFWGFIAGGSSLAIFSMILLGLDGTFRFIDSVRYIESTVWLEKHALDMPTISGILRRNFEITNIELVKNSVWACYLLGIIGFSFVWARSSQIAESHIGVLTLFAILLLPYAHYHDLILLLIPIFCLLRMYQKTGSLHEEYLVLIPLLISWMSVLGFAGTGLLKFPIVYAIMATLGYLLIRAERSFTGSAPVPV